jgi:hypothetical protein
MSTVLSQIGRQLGISQMQVSRLRARALGHLRSRLLDLEDTHRDTPARRHSRPQKRPLNPQLLRYPEVAGGSAC